MFYEIDPDFWFTPKDVKVGSLISPELTIDFDKGIFEDPK